MNLLTEPDLRDGALELLGLSGLANQRPVRAAGVHGLIAHQQQLQQHLDRAEIRTETRLREAGGEQVRLAHMNGIDALLFLLQIHGRDLADGRCQLFDRDAPHDALGSGVRRREWQ